MDIEEIRRSAPSGSTHYKITHRVEYYKVGEKFIFVWFSHPSIPEFVRYVPSSLINQLNINPL